MSYHGVTLAGQQNMGGNTRGFSELRSFNRIDRIGRMTGLSGLTARG